MGFYVIRGVLSGKTALKPLFIRYTVYQLTCVMKLLTLWMALLIFPVESFATEHAPVSEQAVMFKTKKKKGGLFKRIFKKKCKCPKVS